MISNFIAKIEEIYLGLFKIVVIVVLTLALVASVLLLIKGLTEVRVEPMEPPKAAEGKKPKIDTEKFFQELEQREKESTKQSEAESVKAIDQEPDPLDKAVEDYLQKLWVHFDAYQIKCGTANPTDRDTFLQSFPRQILKDWFKRFGMEFAESQDSFVKITLANDRVIEVCKRKQGKAQVFSKSLDWHKTQWLAQQSEAEQFNAAEIRRVKSEIDAEEARVAKAHSDGLKSLWTSLSAFGVFMSLALLLIFSKIESNLRKLRVTNGLERHADSASRK